MINTAFNISPFLVFILFAHFFADFALQTHEQALGKSQKWIPLLQHTGLYALVFFFLMFMWYVRFEMSFVFAVITFIAHTITDYFTSRIARHFSEKEDYHNMFVVVGFDQILHYLQLWFTHIFVMQLFSS